MNDNLAIANLIGYTTAAQNATSTACITFTVDDGSDSYTAGGGGTAGNILTIDSNTCTSGPLVAGVGFPGTGYALGPLIGNTGPGGNGPVGAQQWYVDCPDVATGCPAVTAYPEHARQVATVNSIAAQLPHHRRCGHVREREQPAWRHRLRRSSRRSATFSTRLGPSNI